VFSLDDILGLVGTLDDSVGPDTPRERFRRFLRESVGTTNAVRDYIEACLRNKGSQYDHALQDLVNHAASLIGFEVDFGRYRGVTNEIGYDGLWRRDDFTIVAEVKTTDAYAIRTSTLVGYVDRLISDGRIANWDHAMGLYVVARTDAELSQLANSIIAERRTHQLRVADVETILALAELVQDKQLIPDEAVALLRPAGVFVADTVHLLARMAAKQVDSPDLPLEVVEVSSRSLDAATKTRAINEQEPPWNDHALDRLYLMTPVRDEPDISAREAIRLLLKAGWYVFGESTPGRKRLKPGDRLCFYESGVGIVAEAEVASTPARRPPTARGLMRDLEKYPWSFKITKPRFFFDHPVVIDSTMRSKLEAFVGRDLDRSWSWFVQGTRRLSPHDYFLLTGSSTENTQVPSE
jgi:hypothetical protein